MTSPGRCDRCLTPLDVDGVCPDYCDALDCTCGRDDRIDPHEFGPGCDAWDPDLFTDDDLTCSYPGPHDDHEETWGRCPGKPPPADAPIPCLIDDTVHGRHSWSPMIPDPFLDGVWHVGLADVTCPGWPARTVDR